MRARALLLVIVLLSWSSIASAEKLPLLAYTIADGLHDRVKHIFQDSRGFL
jgi:hypothetical protein